MKDPEKSSMVCNFIMGGVMLVGLIIAFSTNENRNRTHNGRTSSLSDKDRNAAKNIFCIFDKEIRWELIYTKFIIYI